jgi:hypothetical protein
VTVERLKFGGGRADRGGERRALDHDAVPRETLRLSIERLMIRVLADDHVGNQGLRGQPTLDEAGGAGACTTPSPQARQAYFGRRITITRTLAGILSSHFDTSSPMTWRTPPQHGQLLASGSITTSSCGR